MSTGFHPISKTWLKGCPLKLRSNFASWTVKKNDLVAHGLNISRDRNHLSQPSKRYLLSSHRRKIRYYATRDSLPTTTDLYGIWWNSDMTGEILKEVTLRRQLPSVGYFSDRNLPHVDCDLTFPHYIRSNYFGILWRIWAWNWYHKDTYLCIALFFEVTLSPAEAHGMNENKWFSIVRRRILQSNTNKFDTAWVVAIN